MNVELPIASATAGFPTIGPRKWGRSNGRGRNIRCRPRNTPSCRVIAMGTSLAERAHAVLDHLPIDFPEPSEQITALQFLTADLFPSRSRLPEPVDPVYSLNVGYSGSPVAQTERNMRRMPPT